MTDKKDTNDDFDLEALLAGHARSEPSDDLLGRVLGDAYDLQPVAAAPLRPAKVSRWKHAISVFGGWSGIGGLAVAASAGFVIGFSPPAAFEDLLPYVLGEDFVNLEADVDGFGWDLEEDAL